MGRGTHNNGARKQPEVVPLREAAQDVDKILGDELVELVEQYVSAYDDIRDANDFWRDVISVSPVAALCQALQRLRDVSWRVLLSETQAQRLLDMFEVALGRMQSILSLFATLDFRKLETATLAPDVLLNVAVLSLRTCSLYCALTGTLGAPVTLVVEEIGIAMVKCVRLCVKELLGPLFNPGHTSAGNDARRPSNPGANVGGAAGPASAPLPFGLTDAGELINNVASAVYGLHDFLCRHCLSDELLHQLIHLLIGLFFWREPCFPLCAAAEELLVSIFCRADALRSSLLQEYLVMAPKLPSGKGARRFQLPVAEDSTDFGLSIYTHLLLRLTQSSCLPLHEPLGAEVNFSALLAQRSIAQASLAHLTSGLVQRLLMTRGRDEEQRTAFEELVDEVLIVAFKPPWPGALALVRLLVQQLISIVQPDKGKQRISADASAREFSLKLLSKILSRLWQHHVDAKKSHIALPPWICPPEEAPREGRLLQHVALRVSLEEQNVEMPWTAAARAAEAWDAELYLGHMEDDQSGLCSFTDDVAFRYLILAHLEDERTWPARCPPVPGAALSAAVFSSSHPVHAWSFLVCDWAEAAARAQKRAASESADAALEADTAPTKPLAQERRRGKQGKNVQPNTPHALLERLLAVAWTSRTPLCGEGGTWRCGGGKRVLTHFTVYKIYRQLRSAELEGLRRAALDSVVMQANAPQASLRKAAMRALSDLIEVDTSVLASKPVEETVDMRLRDESSWVRQVSLDLLGRTLDSGLDGDTSAEETPVLLSQVDGAAGTASAMLLRFHKTVRGRINDTSVLVRRQATKILSAFVLSHPDHPDVVEVALDLLRRSGDSDGLRTLVLNTFELLWFMDEEPTERAATQLARVVDASRTMGAGMAETLRELLTRFKKNISTRKNSRGFEFAIRRWTTLLLNEFVQLNATPHHGSEPRRKRTKSAEALQTPVPPSAAVEAEVQQRRQCKADLPESSAVVCISSHREAADARWLHRRSLLSTLEAFAAAQPRELVPHLRPLTVYLALEEGAPPEEQWVALKVCTILSAVLPCVSERRGLLDHRQVQQDLQALIKNQPATGVHEAVRCLCQIVKYVTGDLAQLITHLNSAIPTLAHLCAVAETRETAPGAVERVQLMYMSRQVWIISSVLESLDIDEYVENPSAIVTAASTGRRVLPRSALRFECKGPGCGSIAATVADLLVRLYTFEDPRLQAVVVTCLGFFLRGRRDFVKDRRIGEIFRQSLASGEVSLCLKALESLAALLSHFGAEADKETRLGAKNFADSRDGRVAGGSGQDTSLARSAIESAQPLAAHSDAVLCHLTLAGSIGPSSGLIGAMSANADLLRVRMEALSVVRQLHQQGLINPMVVLPRIFALCFLNDAAVSQAASTMLREMLELRPTLLLNRLDEAFREAFLAVLASGSISSANQRLTEMCRFAALADVYSERFRKQKTIRETFIRKALKELFQLEANRFQERFAELSAVLGPNLAGDAPVPPAAKRVRRGNPVDLAGSGDLDGQLAFANLPLLQRSQLLYAQFVASSLGALPFIYESEPLLVVFECNNHLSLHMGSLLAMNGASGTGGQAQDIFAEAVAIVTSVVLKAAMKKEYGLSPDQCAQFNPREARQERLKCSYAARSGASGLGEEVPGSVKLRFPADEWVCVVEPVAANYSNSTELVAYTRSLTDTDVLDAAHGRHASVLERLEGRRQRRGRSNAVEPLMGRKGGRGRGVVRTTRGKSNAPVHVVDEEDVADHEFVEDVVEVGASDQEVD